MITPKIRKNKALNLFIQSNLGKLFNGFKN